MSKIDEAKLDEFVRLVKERDVDTIVGIACSGGDEKDILLCHGKKSNILAATATAHYLVAKEVGVGIGGAIEALLAVQKDPPTEE